MRLFFVFFYVGCRGVSCGFCLGFWFEGLGGGEVCCLGIDIVFEVLVGNSRL